jgi:trans-2,3-dihydro-3-hydroxyanthranilate isomerase
MQGVEMGRPSRLEIEAEKANGAITAIRVGGQAVFVMEGSFRLP